MSEFVRSVDANTYENGKPHRIQFRDLRLPGGYVLRMLGYPGMEPFAFDVAACVDHGTAVRAEGHTLTIAMRNAAGDTRILGNQPFSRSGYMIVPNQGELPHLPDEIEAGYFVGPLSLGSPDVAIATARICETVLTAI